MLPGLVRPPLWHIQRCQVKERLKRREAALWPTAIALRVVDQVGWPSSTRLPICPYSQEDKTGKKTNEMPS